VKTGSGRARATIAIVVGGLVVEGCGCGSGISQSQTPAQDCVSVSVEAVPAVVLAEPAAVFELRAIGRSSTGKLCPLDPALVTWTTSSGITASPSGNPTVVSVPPATSSTNTSNAATSTAASSTETVKPNVTGTTASLPAEVFVTPSSAAAGPSGLWIGQTAATPPVGLLLCADGEGLAQVTDEVVAAAGRILWDPPKATNCALDQPTGAKEVGLFSADRGAMLRQRADLEGTLSDFNLGLNAVASSPDAVRTIGLTLLAFVGSGSMATADAYITESIARTNEILTANRTGLRVTQIGTTQSMPAKVLSGYFDPCVNQPDPVPWMEATLGAPMSSFAGKLPVAVMFGIDGRDGWACQNASGNLAALFLDLDVSDRYEILAHELAHVLGLSKPPLDLWGHTSLDPNYVIAGFDESNLMWEKDLHESHVPRNHLSIGQVYRMNTHKGSWLVQNQSSTATRDCQTATDTATPCPRLAQDVMEHP
jgi:hypothetical protein